MVFMIENVFIKLNNLGTDYQGLQEEEEICKNKIQHSISPKTRTELSKIIDYIHQEKLRILDEMIKINIYIQRYNQQKNVIGKFDEEIFTPSHKVK